MLHPRLSTLIIVLIGAFVAADAQSDRSGAEVIRRVQDRYSRCRNASADFEQRIATRFGGAEQVQHGFVVMAKGNKFKVTMPDQVIVTDGKTVWMYSAATSQVLIDSFREHSAFLSPGQFLNGIPPGLKFNSMKEHDGAVVLSFSPSGGTTGITAVSVTVDTLGWTVTGIDYTDASRTSVRIRLSHIRFDEDLAAREFHFTPAPSMKVVDLRTLR